MTPDPTAYILPAMGKGPNRSQRPNAVRGKMG